MAWSWPGKRPGFPTLDGSPKGEVSLNTRTGTRRSNGSDGFEFKSDWGIITTLQRTRPLHRGQKPGQWPDREAIPDQFRRQVGQKSGQRGAVLML